jgi:hypothetical protein
LEGQRLVAVPSRSLFCRVRLSRPAPVNAGRTVGARRYLELVSCSASPWGVEHCCCSPRVAELLLQPPTTSPAAAAATQSVARQVAVVRRWPATRARQLEALLMAVMVPRQPVRRREARQGQGQGQLSPVPLRRMIWTRATPGQTKSAVTECAWMVLSGASRLKVCKPVTSGAGRACCAGLYRLVAGTRSRAWPASGAWPMSYAAAETIQAAKSASNAHLLAKERAARIRMTTIVSERLVVPRTTSIGARQNRGSSACPQPMNARLRKLARQIRAAPNRSLVARMLMRSVAPAATGVSTKSSAAAVRGLPVTRRRRAR